LETDSWPKKLLNRPSGDGTTAREADDRLSFLPRRGAGRHLIRIRTPSVDDVFEGLVIFLLYSRFTLPEKKQPRKSRLEANGKVK
jgi:hypothetical protein